MSNRNEVVELVAKELQFGQRDGTYLGERIADVLTDAGLLAPDAPEPQEHAGELVLPLDSPDGWEVTATDDYIRLSDERGAIITINRKLARDLGNIFTAAANYAEGNQ